MTEAVEKIPLSAVEETNTSKSKETDEVDLDDFSDSNFVVTGSEQPEEVEILFSNIEKVSGLTAEDIRENLKSLKNKPIEDVTIEIGGRIGRIALDDINIAESSDTPTYHEGSISGTFLPWPKHFTNNIPTKYRFLNPDIYFNTNIYGRILFLITLDGNFILEFNQNGKIGTLVSVSSDLLNVLLISSPIKRITSFNGKSMLVFSSFTKLNRITSLQGNSYFSHGYFSGGYGNDYSISYGAKTDVVLNIILNFKSNLELSFSSVGHVINRISIDGLSYLSLGIYGDILLLSILSSNFSFDLILESILKKNKYVNSSSDFICSVGGSIEIESSYGYDYGFDYS